MRRIAIYDLDGTVINSLHRYRTINDKIDLDYWRANEYRAMEDTLLPHAVQYLKDIRDKNCFVIVATAREMKAPDWQFMATKLKMPDYFIYRKIGDCQSGKTLKANGLQKILNLKQFKNLPGKFYEDNRDYLNAVCDRFKQIEPVFVPSLQGH
jgi:hydroxymethylpyrimidine pyrophosphatase-like HAD family hydrolase